MVVWPPVLGIVALLALVGATLWVVFFLIQRAIDRDAAALQPEGVELDSGPLTLTTRYRNFRAPGIYALAALRRTPGRIVLTARRLHILCRPQRYGIIDRDELHRFTVRVLDGRLQLRSEDPPGASGTIDFRAPVPDPGAWVTALIRAGAKEA
jgi:hypothetical protein